MSLLMDALKKAEKEKQKAADDTTAVEATQTGEQHQEAAQASAHTQPTAESLEHSDGLSLEPLDESGSAPIPPVDDEEAVDLTASSTQTVTGASTTDTNLLEGFDGTTTGSDSVTITRTGEGFEKDATLPSERTIKASVDEYFDASLSLQRTTDTGSIRGELDTGLNDGTQVGAQTVFSASKRSNPYGPATWIAMLAAVVLISLAVAYGYYYLQTPTPVAVPSPTVARTIDSAGQKAPIELPALPSRTTENTLAPAGEAPAAASDEAFTVVEHPDGPGLGEPAGEAMTTATTDRMAATVTGTGTDTRTDTPTAGTDTLTMTEPVGEELVVVIDDEPVGIIENVQQKISEIGAALSGGELVPALMPAEERAALAPARLQITRTSQPPKINQQIQRAYSAYSAGNYQQAGELYKSVLQQDDSQRDALLGLAAIAQHYGDRVSAARYYRRLLKLNPQDQVAAAALFHLNGAHAGTAVSESQLKLLLDQNPASAPIHFSLGSLYARKSRWADAQQAFFEAWRADQQNPDYAYNLAVSLDHLNQHRAALDFYQRALAAADSRANRFNPAQVTARIQALSAQ